MTRRKRIPTEVLETAATAFRVMAHPLRLRLCELLEEQSRTVGELAELCDVSANTVSQHMKLLKAHGVATASRDGRHVRYRIEHPAPLSMLACIRRTHMK
jgi:DNA-binding transcriptional ArsR family regulator